jgi:hypothetical protein
LGKFYSIPKHGWWDTPEPLDIPEPFHYNQVTPEMSIDAAQLLKLFHILMLRACAVPLDEVTVIPPDDPAARP